MAGLYHDGVKNVVHEFKYRPVLTFPDERDALGNQRPSVAGGIRFKTDNSAPTTIKNFLNAQAGQEIIILFGTQLILLPINYGILLHPNHFPVVSATFRSSDAQTPNRPQDERLILLHQQGDKFYLYSRKKPNIREARVDIKIRDEDDCICGGCGPDDVGINPSPDDRDDTDLRLGVDLVSGEIRLLRQNGSIKELIGGAGYPITVQGHRGDEQARITFVIEVEPYSLAGN